MKTMNIWQVICLLLLFTDKLTVDGADQPPEFDNTTEYVTYKDTTVELECPGLDPENLLPVTWVKNTEELPEKTNTLVIKDYQDKDNDLYYCTRDKKFKMYFYTKIKVCNGCIEMDMTWTALLMFGDIFITLGVIILVYMCSKKKTGSAPPQRGAKGPQARAPPPPEPDYQRLNQATRSKDLYAEAKRKY
ncbi:hypothetical protein NFI96_030824 [Prochilodus magdalenae]|nr:hypothetical protein NFI96_030824 [Prochilodus magdalenae]